MKKRILSILLSIAVIIAMMPANAFAGTSDDATEAKTFEVSSAAQLEKALEEGVTADIIITDDFAIDRTFYISAPTTIRTTENHKLTRKWTFTGDMFVVGEDKNGREITLDGGQASLKLGDPDGGAELVIDGNKDNMLGGLKVNGTAIFISYSGIVDIYPGVSIINCKKETNKRLLSKDYALSNPAMVGGSVAIVTNGTLNIYGGTFSGNEVNNEDSSIPADDPNYRVSSRGGVIYNFGNVKIYGGNFSDNYAARGGVVYNYKKVKIYAGTFENNTAAVYGGVAYCPDSQYSNLILGGSEEAAAKCSGGECNSVFRNNSAGTGGVLFSQTKSGIVIYEDANALFENNRAVNYNGGAVAASGAFTLKGGATFKNNDSNSKGGAIYFSNAKEELVTRKPELHNAEFIDNTAARGGAIALTAKADTFNEGGILALEGCLFEGNRAVEGKQAYGSDKPDVSTNGGAIYISRKSKMNVDNCTFKDNVSELKEGGAIYITAESPVNITGTTFTGNKCLDGNAGNGGAIANHGSLLKISGSTFEANDTERHGGALYLSYKNLTEGNVAHSYTKVTDTEFKNDESRYHGGAIYITSNEAVEDTSYLKMTGCTMSGNKALHNGGAVYTTKSTVYLEDNDFRDNYVDAVASDNGKRYGGGAIYGTSSHVDINGAEMTGNVSDYNGGAMAFYADTDVKMNKVNAKGNSTVTTQGGAIYINGTVADIYNSTFEENRAGSGGGAISVYSNAHMNMFDSEVKNNSCVTNGGGIVFNISEGDGNVAGTGYLKNVKVIGNTAEAANSGNYGGGGIFSKAGQVELNGCEIKDNTAAGNGYGGAIALYTSSQLVMNETAVEGNKANYRGGGIYSSGGNIDVFGGSFEKNESVDYGGAIGIPTNVCKLNVYGTAFTENKTTGAATNGGAIWFYSAKSGDDAGNAVLQNCKFTGNAATQYGGAIAIQNGTAMQIYDAETSENTAGKYGGFLYAGSTGTTATINGITSSGNTGTKGKTVYSGENPVISVNKDRVQEIDNPEFELTSPAVSPEWEVDHLDFIDSDVPEAKKYEQKGSDSTYTAPEEKKEPYYVEDEDADQYIEPEVRDSDDSIIFELAEGEPEYSKINSKYDKLPKADNPTNFQSLGTTRFDNINGKTVTVDSLVYHHDEKKNNTILPIGLLIYQAMDYKRAHPEKSVRIDLSTFRLSSEVAVCINRESKYFGYMRQLIGKDYDRNGFVRIVYLLVEAAKMGIDVHLSSQLDGEPHDSMDPGFDEYFTNHLTDKCHGRYVSDPSKTVGDYMDYHQCEWTSYDNLPAADMLHTKICAVSNYRDKDGVDHGGSFWIGSSNIDGIMSTGISSKNKLQTAVIVSDHDELYRVAVNYLSLIFKHCDQEGIKDLREIMANRNETQIKQLENGKTVDPEKQVVYLGSDTDKVFELYFTPFGGDVGTWDEQHNPFCKYIKKLRKSEDYVLLSWVNVKWVHSSYQLARTFNSMINETFQKNKNPKNRVYIQAIYVKNGVSRAFDGSELKKLKIGKDVGAVSVNERLYGYVHSKDLQVSYVENGKRQYVSVLNSINFHEGASFNQSNHVIVIKENKGTKGTVFYNIAKNTSNGIVSTDVTKIKPVLSNTAYTYDGKSKKPTVSARASDLDYTLTYDKNCKTVGKHKVKITGKGIGTGTKTLYYKINPKGTSISKLTKAKKAFTVKWKKQSAKMSSSTITGYQICYSTSSSFKTSKTVSVKGYSKTSKKISSLKAGKKYYVKIRTYKIVSGTKYYSPWSKVKTVKTK